MNGTSSRTRLTCAFKVIREFAGEQETSFVLPRTTFVKRRRECGIAHGAPNSPILAPGIAAERIDFKKYSAYTAPRLVE
jgi:hypothetical protein